MKKWAKIALMIVLILIFNSYLTSAVPTQNVWAVYAHDSQRTGRSPYSGPSSPTLEWEFDILLNVNQQYCAALAIGSDDTVYVGSSDKVLVIKDGQESTLWQAEGCVVYSVAVGSDGTIYVGASYDIGTAEEHGIVHALRPDGTGKWSFPVDGIIYNPIAIGADGTIFMLTHHGPLYAIDPHGNLKWTRAISGTYGGIAIGPDGTIYAGGGGAGGFILYAYNQDGTEIWHSAIGPDAQLVIGDDGTIYVVGYEKGSLERTLFALDPNGSVKWRKAHPYPDFHPAIGGDGTLYMAYGGENKLRAINPDGSEKWIIDVPTIWNTAPIIDANNTIYIGGEIISAFNPDGSLKWSYQMKGQPIAIDSSGRVYYSGSLYTIGGPRGIPLTVVLAIAGVALVLIISAAWISHRRAMGMRRQN